MPAGGSDIFPSKRPQHPSANLLRYSDVVHEVTPLTKGYRFVLTFNLTADPQGARPSAKMNFDAHDGLRRLLRQWQSYVSSSKGSSCDSVIHPLDHEYTEQGMKLQSLKGKDLDMDRALCEACSATGLLCFLASCEKRVFGSCEENSSYNSRFDDYGSEYSEDLHDIVDVFDTGLCLKRIVDMKGKLVAENVDINEGDFLEEDPFEGRTPDDEDYSGFTGNEGVSATQRYRDTVGSSHAPMGTIAKPPGHRDCAESYSCRFSHEGIRLGDAHFESVVQYCTQTQSRGREPFQLLPKAFSSRTR